MSDGEERLNKGDDLEEEQMEPDAPEVDPACGRVRAVERVHGRAFVPQDDTMNHDYVIGGDG